MVSSLKSGVCLVALKRDDVPPDLKRDTQKD